MEYQDKSVVKISLDSSKCQLSSVIKSPFRIHVSAIIMIMYVICDSLIVKQRVVEKKLTAAYVDLSQRG